MAAAVSGPEGWDNEAAAHVQDIRTRGNSETCNYMHVTQP